MFVGCINLKSSAFKSRKSKYGVSSADLEGRITHWMSMTGLPFEERYMPAIDSYLDRIYLVKSDNVYKKISLYKKAMKVYEAVLSNNIFDSYEEAVGFYKRLETMFDAKYITLMQQSNGSYKVELAKPMTQAEYNTEIMREQVHLIFTRNPKLAEVGTEEEYIEYLQTIFPNSVELSVYWHGSNSDFSHGFVMARRLAGSGAPEVATRDDFYLAKLAWSVIQYVDGVNRTSRDKNGFGHWNKLWLELKEILSNGRKDTNDWKDEVISEETIRLAIPNKKGIFDRTSDSVRGDGHGTWLSERKADYGYLDRTDREFFEEVFGINFGEDTFNSWIQRNAAIFQSMVESAPGIFPVILNVGNPIKEKGLNTYYGEQRGLITQAELNGNDAILGEQTDNEFGSDVAVMLNIGRTNDERSKHVHFLGTEGDLSDFRDFKNEKLYRELVEDKSLNIEKTDIFITNLLKFLNSTPRYKGRRELNTENSIINILRNAVSDTNALDRFEKILSYILPEGGYLRLESRESFLKSLDSFLESLDTRLEEIILRTDSILSDAYRELHRLEKLAEVLQRALDSNLYISKLSKSDADIFSEIFNGLMPSSSRAVGFKLLKVKQAISNLKDTIVKKSFKAKAKRISAQTRLIALKVIPNLKTLIRERLIAEYDALTLKDEQYQEYVAPKELIFKLIKDVANSGTLEELIDENGPIIGKNITSAESLADALSEHNPQVKELLSLFLKANPNLKVEIVDDLEEIRKRANSSIFGRAASFFLPSENKLVLYSKCSFLLAIHELTHAATYYALVSKVNNGASLDLYVLRLMNHVRKYLGTLGMYDRGYFAPLNFMGAKFPADIYGFTNPSEFLAEVISNPKFLALLDSIPAMEDSEFKEAHSLLEEFWDWVVKTFDKIFGTNYKNSALKLARELVIQTARGLLEHINEIYELLDNYRSHKTQNIVFKESKSKPKEDGSLEYPYHALMTLFYEGNSRPEIKAKSTFGAIILGLRIATTRFGDDGGPTSKANSRIAWWKKIKAGDIVAFKDSYDEILYVRITKPIRKLTAKDSAEEWSKKEGWTTEVFNKKVRPKLGYAYQIEFEYIGKELGSLSTETDWDNLKEGANISTARYKKEDPANHPDVAFMFTENAQAAGSVYKDSLGYQKELKGKFMLNVSDARGTNQACVRMKNPKEANLNAFGIVVKKKQLDDKGNWLKQEGCFEDTAKDFKMFKAFNERAFEDLDESGLTKMLFPSLIALGKAALPLKFATWLRDELKKRYGVEYKIELNKTTGYSGYGLRAVTEDSSKESTPSLGSEFKKLGDKSDVNGFVARFETSDNDDNIDYELLEKSAKAVEQLIADMAKRVKKSPNFAKDHTYLVFDGKEWKPADTSVTQFVHKEESKPDELWGAVASGFGNAVDEATRLFFMGKDIREIEITNLTREARILLYSDLIRLRKSFDEKFGKGAYRVVTEEFALVGTFKDGQKTKTIAGTMDMLIYDDKGNFYIYDMKTSRMNSADPETKWLAKIPGYSRQTSIYLAMCEAGSKAMRGHIKETRLIRFDTYYYAPKKGRVEYSTAPDGTILLNGDPITDFEIDSEFRYPILHTTKGTVGDGTLVPTIKNESLEILALELTEDEAAILELELGVPVKKKKEKAKPAPIKIITPEKATPKVDVEVSEEAKQWAKLKQSLSLTHTLVLFAANNIMNLASKLVTEIQNGEHLEDYHENYRHLVGRPREEIISAVTVNRLLEYVKEFFVDPEYADTEELKANLLELRDNWEALKRLGNNKLILLEHVTLAEMVNGEEIKQEGIDLTVEAENESGKMEESTREHYLLGQRLISAKSSLSTDIRRVFESLPVLNSAGELLCDPVFGFPMFVDSGKAINCIFEWCNNCETITEMEEKIAEHLEEEPWVASVLEEIKKEPFRSQFFNNFRKDWTLYSITICSYNKETHRMEYKLHVINSNTAELVLLDEVKTVFHDTTDISDIISSTNIDGLGILKSAFVPKHRKVVNALNAEGVKSGKGKQYKLSIELLTKELQAIGFKDITTDIVEKIVKDDGKKKNFQNTNRGKILTALTKALNALEQMQLSQAVLLANGEDVTLINPFNLKNNSDSKSFYNACKDIAKILAPAFLDSVESSAYQNGKMYYSFVTPSAMGRIIKNLRDALGNPSKRDEYIERNYGQYGFFKDEETGEWLNPWLADDEYMKDGGLDHKVLLSFNGTDYVDLSELNYTLSIIHEYFVDTKSTGATTYAWYRVPMLSNKPSSEFIKEKRFKGIHYKLELAKRYRLIFLLEIRRMKTVLEAAALEKNEPIKNFDISKKNRAAHKALFDKIRKNIKAGKPYGITIDDLITVNKVTGKKELIFKGSGASFKFLEAFNDEIINKTEFGYAIVAMLNGDVYNPSVVNKAFKAGGALYSSFDVVCENAFKKWEELGMFEVVAKTRTVNKQKKLELHFKYLDLLVPASVWTAAKKKVDAEHPDIDKDIPEYVELVKKEVMPAVKAALEEFIWNDTMACINIIELTATDLAYYKNVEDFQKRYALLHSPAIRLNKEALDSNGLRYGDSYSRTMYLADDEVKSEIKENVRVVFERKIALEKNASKKESLKRMMEVILTGFDKINVADALGYSCPVSYRKKLGMLGEWTDEMEEAYLEIENGNFNIENFNVVWQPLKPFVYTKISKSTGGLKLDRMPVPVQNKNSEFLLLIANAVIRSDKEISKKSRLVALFDFMEDTAYTGRERAFNGYVYRDGVKTSKRTKATNGTILSKRSEEVYNGLGIDTILFESAVKSGLMGVVDVNGKSYSDTILTLYDRAHSRSNRDDYGYSEDYVHTFEWEDYGIQQKVPAHLEGELLMGSLIRILSISDIENPDEIIDLEDSDGNPMTMGAAVREYKELIAANILDSFEKLKKVLKLDFGSRQELNKALAALLRDEMMKDLKYDEDLKFACELDPVTGEFNVPLCDPILASRILLLLNSIIKSRINKQKVPGGPVVQTSMWGLSEDLNIVFKNKEGKLLLTFRLFSELVNSGKLKNVKGIAMGKKLKELGKKSVKELSAEELLALENDILVAAYKEYISENQGSLACYECLLPIPNEDMRQALTKPDGSLMTVLEALDANIITEDVLRGIGYRIPTEDKYSMFPFKIVGFLPSALEAIILPKEITLLSGSDFDIDKDYIMFKSFVKTKLLKKKLILYLIDNKVYKNKKDVVEQVTLLSEYMASGMSLEESLGLTDDKIVEVIQNNPGMFITAQNFVENTSEKAKRDSRIFDILWAILTHESTLSKMFNPGSFDVQKISARIITILKQPDNKYTYKLLREIADKLGGLDALEKLANSGSSENIVHITTLVAFHKLNMTAGKLIGIFANNNTSHAFLLTLHIGLHFAEDDHGFTFNGVRVDNSHNNLIDAVYALDGITFISKNIAGFLAASVDAVKDPVLNFMNLNLCTAGVAMLLARLGFDSDSIGLFLTLPCIEELARRWATANNEGFASASDIADMMIKQIAQDNDLIEALLSKLHTVKFTKDELAKGLKGTDNTTDVLNTLLLFKKLADTAAHLGTITFLTKFNSITNAVGPEIADTLVMEMRYKKFVHETMEGDSAPFTPNAAFVIDNDPILKAFYETTVGEKGASVLLFKPYFPHYSDSFLELLYVFSKSCKGDLSAEDIKKLMNYYMLFLMSSSSNKVFSGDFETRKHFIKDYPEIFAEHKEIGQKFNTLLAAIKIKSADEKIPVAQLEAKTGSYSVDILEQMKAAWSDMFRDMTATEIAKLGEDLFVYNLFRNGVSFSPKTFLHLASTVVKRGIADGNYVAKLMASVDAYGVDIASLLTLYRRNNPTDRKCVVDLYFTDPITYSVDENTNTCTIDISKKKGNKGVVISRSDSCVVLAPMVSYDGHLYYIEDNIVNPKTTSVTYLETTPLGIKNNFIEIDGDATDAFDMKSVFRYSEDYEAPEDNNNDDDGLENSPEDHESDGGIQTVKVNEADLETIAKAVGIMVKLGVGGFEGLVADKENDLLSKPALAVIKKFFDSYSPANKKEKLIYSKIIETLKKIC